MSFGPMAATSGRPLAGARRVCTRQSVLPGRVFDQVRTWSPSGAQLERRELAIALLETQPKGARIQSAQSSRRLFASVPSPRGPRKRWPDLGAKYDERNEQTGFRCRLNCDRARPAPNHATRARDRAPRRRLARDFISRPRGIN